MKTKLSIIALSLISVSTGFSAVYNVTTGTSAVSSGIAPTSLGTLSSPAAAALAGSFSGFVSPTGIVAYGVFGTYAGPGNTGLFSSLSDVAISGAVDTGLTTLVSAFQIFGATGDFNAAGAFGSKGVFTRNTSATVTGSIFSGKNIYAFIGNADTFADSTQLLVLKSGTTYLDAQDAIPTALTVTLGQANTTLLFGRNLADVKTTTADASVTAGWGTAAAVPEPSAVLLGALGALGLLRRRRN